jgi:predicted metalloprotease with PDZ domain
MLKTDLQLDYTLSFPEPSAHRVEVAMNIPAGGELELWMPVWTPGSYLVREFSRHVQDLRAESASGAPLPVTKTRKNRWKVEANDATGVTVRYVVYGRELSVRTNWIEPEFALLNGAPTFLAVRGFENAPHRVRLRLPEAWKGAWTSLPPAATSADPRQPAFTARNLDELIDSPVLAGTADMQDFQVNGVPISLVNAGDATLWNGQEAAGHAQKIVETYARMMGGLPFDRYLFLNCIVESRGGLEHAKSCVLMTSRYAYRKRKSYVDWLGLVSHEFFHAWNVKRLRPVALGPFDYENEVYTRSLWFAEGVTSYYTPLMPRRAGLTKNEELFDALSEQIEKLQTTPGRLHQSLEESSFDAWIKLYRPDENTGNTTISYYVKGAVVAWLLDAEIRAATRGARSLDDLLRLLFARYAGDRGYTDADLQKSAEEIAGTSLEALFARSVRGREELDYTPALRVFGLRFKPPRAGLPDTTPPVWMGIETAVRDGKLFITSVRDDAPARSAGLAAEDEILALDGLRIDPRTWTERLQQYRPGDRTQVLIARRDAMRTHSLTFAEHPGSPWRLEIDPDASADAVRDREAWMR